MINYNQAPYAVKFSKVSNTKKMIVKVVSLSTGTLINQLIFSQNFLFEAVLYGKNCTNNTVSKACLLLRDIKKQNQLIHHHRYNPFGSYTLT